MLCADAADDIFEQHSFVMFVKSGYHGDQDIEENGRPVSLIPVEVAIIVSNHTTVKASKNSTLAVKDLASSVDTQSSFSSFFQNI